MLLKQTNHNELFFDQNVLKTLYKHRDPTITEKHVKRFADTNM